MSTESKLHPVFQEILEAHGLASVQQPCRCPLAWLDIHRSTCKTVTALPKMLRAPDCADEVKSLEVKLAELARLLEELKDNVEFRAGKPGDCLLLDKTELSKPEPMEGGELCLVVWVG